MPIIFDTLSLFSSLYLSINGTHKIKYVLLVPFIATPYWIAVKFKYNVNDSYDQYALVQSIIFFISTPIILTIFILKCKFKYKLNIFDNHHSYDQL